jgi:6-phospho-beta-glucosidase
MHAFKEKKMTKQQFPEGFLWGGDVNTPRKTTRELVPDAFYPSHEAIDHFHRFKEDIALFAEMGFKLYRARMSMVRTKIVRFCRMRMVVT